jgi:hypothetical protein
VQLEGRPAVVLLRVRGEPVGGRERVISHGVADMARQVAIAWPAGGRGRAACRYRSDSS